MFARRIAYVFFGVAVCAIICAAQTGAAQQPQTEASTNTSSSQADSPLPSAPSPATTGSASTANAKAHESEEGKQPKRILGIIPNYRAVSADTKVPPLSVKGKFVLAAQDSFDYSAFLVAGVFTGISYGRDSYPELHQGAAGFGRYYWRAFADQAVGNYFTEFLLPSALHEDPRYYTRFHGGFFSRTGYAVTRLFITRTDSGGSTFNFSEIIGNGAGAGVSNLYYPSQERTWTKTGQKWASQVALDGIFNVLKEFWPNIRHSVFHR